MKKSIKLIIAIIMVVCFLNPISAEDANGVVEPNLYDIEFQSISSTYGTKKRVSAEALGPCTITIQYSVTTVSSWSLSITASVKNVVINKLDADIGIEFNNSSQSSVAYSVTYNVSSGKYGSVYFTPRLKVVIFTFDDNVNGTRRCILKFPMKVNGFTDGYYELVER